MKNTMVTIVTSWAIVCSLSACKLYHWRKYDKRYHGVPFRLVYTLHNIEWTGIPVKKNFMRQSNLISGLAFYALIFLWLAIIRR